MATFIRYIISSHISYEQYTVGRLLDSMRTINPFHIVVVVGGASKASEHLRNGVTFLYVQHNSYEYTGLIEILERDLPGDWWFWLHDTCQCGPHFRERAEGLFDRTTDVTAAYVTQAGEALCNLGMYSANLLRRNRDYISSWRGLDKREACVHEGRLYRTDHGSKSAYPNSKIFQLGTTDVYQAHNPRMIEYYAAIDLYKFKANWGANIKPGYVREP